MTNRIGLTPPPGQPHDVEAWQRTASERGPLAPGSPDAPPGQAGPTMRYPPHIYPPIPYSQDLYAAQSGTGITVTGPNTVALIPGASFQLPKNMVGVLRELTLDINSTLLTTNCFFTLLVNGGPWQGYAQMRVFPRVAASQAINFPPESTYIRVSDGALIQMQVTVVDGGSYRIGSTFRGWFFSKTVAASFGWNV